MKLNLGLVSCFYLFGPQGYMDRMANIRIISDDIIGVIPIPDITERQIDEFMMSITNHSLIKM